MGALLYLLIPALFVGAYLARWDVKTRSERRMRKRFGRQTKKPAPMWVRKLVRRGTIFWTLFAAGLGAVTAIYVLHMPVAFGIVAGGALPAFAIEIYQERWMVRYEDGVRQAVELGTGIVEAGGTVEEWILQGEREIEGPLQAVFARGAQQVRERLSVADWLRYTADTTPSNYWSYVCNGVLSHLDSGGDLVRFFVEVARELQVREKYRRVMAQQRKEATQLLLAMLVSPAALYLMFRRTLDNLMQAEPFTQVLFAIALVGYVVLFWFARRMARAKEMI